MLRPWNRITTPVYSLVTYDASAQWNANIVTYACAVSINPKRYLIALDPVSKTHQNFKRSGRGLLQILSEDNLSQVPLLGKKSGFKVDKHQGLEPILNSAKTGDEILPGILGYLELEGVQSLGMAEGDHELFICTIKSSANVAEGKALHLQHLINAGLILRPRSLCGFELLLDQQNQRFHSSPTPQPDRKEAF